MVVESHLGGLLGVEVGLHASDGTHHERIPNGLTTSLKKPRSDSFDSKRKPGSFSGRLQDVARLLLARLLQVAKFFHLFDSIGPSVAEFFVRTIHAIAASFQ